MILLYIITCGALNSVRGVDKVSRGVFVLLNFCLAYAYLGFDWKLSLIVAIGILGWLMRRWGKYFMAEEGWLKTHKEKGLWPIDIIVDKVLGTPTTRTEARNWGTLAMSLRGFFFAIPLYGTLGWYLGNYYITLLSLGMLLQGPWYRTIVYHRSYRIAEFLTAVTYSSLIAIATMV